MRVLSLAFCLALLVACAPRTEPPGADTRAQTYDAVAVAEAVEAMIVDWAKTGEEGRWEDLKALYADDPAFYWVEDGRLAYDSRAGAAAGVDQAAAMNAMIRSTVSDIVVTPLGADEATFRAAISIGFVGGDFSFEFDGVFTGLAVRREDKWMFLQGHLSKPDGPAN